MALIFMDGFDQYGTDSTNMLSGPWAEVTITPTALPYDGSYILLSQSNPRTGLNSLFRPGNRSALGTTANQRTTFAVCRKVLGVGGDTIGVGFAVYQTALPVASNKEVFVDFRDENNTKLVTITELTDGTIVVKSGSRWGAEIARSAEPILVAEAYQHIEIIIHFDDTNGSIEVRVDGVTVINASGINTGAAICNQLSFFTADAPIDGTDEISTEHLSDAYIDDIFSYDNTGSYNNDFIGDRRVRTIYPDSDEATQEWTGVGSSTNYGAINEITPDGDSTYISAPPTAPLTSEFGLSDLPSSVGAISALQTYVMQKKVEAGDGNTQSSINVNGSSSVGADRAITTAYTYWSDVFEISPDTGAPFTPSEVNSATLSIKRTTA